MTQNNEQNTQLDSNIFLLTFYVSKHQGQERIVSKHPATGEFIFPHHDWKDLGGGTKVQVGVQYHCTLDRIRSGHCWIATPCVGMSLTTEAKELEVKAARLEKREKELNSRAQELESLRASIVKRTNALEEQEAALHLGQKQLHREKESLEPYRNALAKAASKINEARIEIIDLLGQVDKLNRKLSKDDRINTDNLLDKIRNEAVVPKLSDIAAAAKKTATPKNIFRFPKSDAVGWR